MTLSNDTRTLRAAYNSGRMESTKLRDCDTWDCACTVTYWERRLSNRTPEYRRAFFDGWSDAATGEREYAHLYL